MDRTVGGLQLSLLDWELIFTDFKIQNRSKWLSQYSGLAILEQALYIIAKKDYPLKLQLLEFIEENIEILIGEDDTEEGLGSVVEALRTVLDASSDGVTSVSSLLKEQMMITATVALITLDSLHRALHELQMLVEILLGVINRPNYGLDRQARGTASECLRELEKAYPCLLHTCAGHINFLFSSERTHVAQSYTLLLTTILRNLALYMYTALPGSRSGGPSSFLSTSSPLIPFIVPSFLVSSETGEEALSIPSRELSSSILKEFKRVVGSFLDRPQLLTSSGMLEFVSSLIDIAAALELQGSILKVQLYNFMYTYSPLLCHAILMIYFHFMDSFEGEEEAIFRRFILLCNDPQQPLVVRMLAVHWLLGLDSLLLEKDKRSLLASMTKSMYPLIYDPLSLKALKLDSLAHSSACLQFANVSSESKTPNSMADSSLEKEIAASKLFKDGTVCLSAFRWLPSWSSETRLMFRMFHRFLTVDGMQFFSEAPSNNGNFNSTLFKTLEAWLVSLALQFRRLVPCLLMLVDKLLLCEEHSVLGEHLLQVFNADLLRQLAPDKHLAAYFLILERIAENGSIPPGAIVDILIAYSRNQAIASETTASGLWIRGSQVLLICRTIMVHHYSSRAFHSLSTLLAFLVVYFPDVEVQDTARIYLRMLISIPGMKLRTILKYGDEGNEDSQFSKVSSLLQTSPLFTGYKQSVVVASYIKLTRATSLLVGESWSLVPHDFFQSVGQETDHSIDTGTSKEPDNLVQVHENEDLLPNVDDEVQNEEVNNDEEEISDETKILHQYFALIPDYVNESGLKVKVQCFIKFKADVQNSHAEDSPSSMLSGPDFEAESWPALYAVVVSFRTTGPYGPIPSVHIPFLMSVPSNDSTEVIAGEDSSLRQLQIVNNPLTVGLINEDAQIVGESPLHVDNAKGIDTNHDIPQLEAKGNLHPDTDGISIASEQINEDAFRESIVLELEPKQPVPTIIDAFVTTSDENGKHINGQLDSIHVGIEDLFTKALVPHNVSSSDLPAYNLNLFNALWEAFNRTEMHHKDTFTLSGGKLQISLVGTESVKLLESRANKVIDALERHLAPYVVSASGGPLVSILQDSGMFKDVIWEEDSEHEKHRPRYLAIAYDHLQPDEMSNQLYDYRAQSAEDFRESVRENIGSLCVLIFLPPRFHILFKIDVADWSTQVHIRTDHWPCLAYVDEYLEALIT